jgi:hypothetical protein
MHYTLQFVFRHLQNANSASNNCPRNPIRPTLLHHHQHTPPLVNMRLQTNAQMNLLHSPHSTVRSSPGFVWVPPRSVFFDRPTLSIKFGHFARSALQVSGILLPLSSKWVRILVANSTRFYSRVGWMLLDSLLFFVENSGWYFCR